MKYLDRVIQRWRSRVAARWVPDGSRVLDVGCHQGEFLAALSGRIRSGVGMDPLAIPRRDGNVKVVRESFEDELPFEDACLDVVVLLATMEHLQAKRALAAECARVLSDGGHVILTLPAQAVDYILACLHSLKLIDGMSLEEHHGFDPRDTPGIFAGAGFSLRSHRRFQLGLNNLFVFHKPATAGNSEARPSVPQVHSRTRCISTSPDY